MTMNRENSDAVLKRGIALFRNGIRYTEEKARTARRGYRLPSQIIIDRAEGDYIWDLDGNRYIDFQNGWATNPLGNAHPEVIEAVDAAHRRYGFHYDHPLRYELAERLAEIMPGRSLPRFSYEVSGTEAAEAAVNMALCFTKRRYVITFAASYHGNSLGGKLLSGLDSGALRYMEAWTGGVIRAPYPYSGGAPAGMSEDQYVEFCLWYVENHIPDAVAPRDNIAAILIEPGLAEGGNWIPSTSFLRGLRRLCDRNDWLLIADEVLTGLGRTGAMWAVEHYDVVPDLLVVGKNLSGGIAPCAGVAARDDVLGNNPDSSSGSTFSGTPAGCAAGLKTLEIFERDGIVEQAAKLGEVAADIMAGWKQYGVVREIRQNGLLIGVSFQSPNDDESDEWYAKAIKSRMLDSGVWAISDRECNVRLYPALNMDENVLRDGLSRMEEAIACVDRHGQDLGDSPALPTGTN